MCMGMNVCTWKAAQIPCWHVEVMRKPMCLYEAGSFMLLNTVMAAPC